MTDIYGIKLPCNEFLYKESIKINNYGLIGILEFHHGDLDVDSTESIIEILGSMDNDAAKNYFQDLIKCCKNRLRLNSILKRLIEVNYSIEFVVYDLGISNFSDVNRSVVDIPYLSKINYLHGNHVYVFEKR
jgi:hypothetical protein